MLKYIKIKESIIKEINSGELKPGDKLLVREELIKKYKVARPTLNRALLELIQEEYLVAFRNKGTFVSKQTKKIKIALISNFGNRSIDKDGKDFHYNFDALKYILFSYKREEMFFLEEKK